MRDPYKEVDKIIRSQLAGLERDLSLLANAASVSCEYYVPFTGESGKCYSKDCYIPNKDSCESWIMRSHSCQECEFYCHTPPNEGLCNVTLGKALGRGVCRNFVPQLHRSKSSDAKKASSCFSCGTPLEIEIHGRRKYCAHCKCYLPEILYDHRFTELVNPMESVKPPRLGTVYKEE